MTVVYLLIGWVFGLGGIAFNAVAIQGGLASAVICFGAFGMIGTLLTAAYILTNASAEREAEGLRISE